MARRLLVVSLGVGFVGIVNAVTNLVVTPCVRTLCRCFATICANAARARARFIEKAFSGETR
jgi:hypothetical protein